MKLLDKTRSFFGYLTIIVDQQNFPIPPPPPLLCQQDEETIRMEPRCWMADIKVDFDKTKHLTDEKLQRRKAKMEKFINDQKEKAEKEQRCVEWMRDLSRVLERATVVVCTLMKMLSLRLGMSACPFRISERLLRIISYITGRFLFSRKTSYQ